MLCKVKCAFIAVFCLLATFQVQAQTADRPVWLSVRIGHNEYDGDYGSEFFEFDVGADPAFGFSTGLYLNRSVDLVFDFDFGVLDREDQINPRLIESFSNPFISTNLLARYKFSNGYLLQENTVVQPYLKAGVGLTTYTGDGERVVNGDSAGATPSGSTFTIPLGAGVDIPVADGVSIVVESMYHRTFAEGFDGRDRLDASSHDDYFIHSVGVKFALSGSKDDQRIPDPVDIPPPETEDEPEEEKKSEEKEKEDVSQDLDGDGFEDSKDRCPRVAGVDYLDGCPDADGDRIADSNDECPTLAGLPTANGCPDADEDGIKNSEDVCPTIAGVAGANGCPDSDGDNIANWQDECPEEAGSAEFNGCPEENIDEGNIDEENIDSDGDGISDADDRCPQESGVAKNDGCPAVVLKDLQQELESIEDNIQFNIGSTTLSESSLKALDRVAETLAKDQKLNLIIDAYTDSQGKAALNLQISRKRAEAVKTYLVNQGIAAERLRAEGYGEILPVASNDTPQGRRQNRRIELRLTYF